MNWQKRVEISYILWWLIKIISILLVGFVIGFFWYEINQSKTVWRYSDSLSFSLYIYSENDFDLANKIDAIQVYEDTYSKGQSYFLSTTINERNLIYDTRDKEIIKQIISGFIYEEIALSNRSSCGRQVGDRQFHVIAYDRTLIRAGYLVVYICEDEISEYAQIKHFTRDIFTSSLSTSRKLPTLFRELGIIY